jgi:hypothetical protein
MLDPLSPLQKGTPVSLHQGDLDKHLDYVKTIPAVIEPLGGTEESDEGEPTVLPPSKRRAVKSQPVRTAETTPTAAKRSRQSTASESSGCGSKALVHSPSSDEEPATTGDLTSRKPSRKRKRAQQQPSKAASSDSAVSKRRSAGSKKDFSLVEDDSDDSEEEDAVQPSSRRSSKALVAAAHIQQPLRSASASPLKVRYCNITIYQYLPINK